MFLEIGFLLLFASFGLSDPTLVVIGAGASGIAAATRLLQHGITNITILEANDQIGGRIHSVSLGGRYVDTGAEWCHGEKGNVVYDLVKDLGILQGTPPFYLEIYHSKLKLLNPDFSHALNDIFFELLVESMRSKESVSVGELLIAKYEQVIDQWKDDPSNYKLAQQAIVLLEACVIGFNGGFSWFDLAADVDFVISEGDQNLHWNGLGFKTILNVLMEKSPPINDKILFKKEVRQIIWDSKEAVVQCTDNSSYSADHVIMTVSLGVLKHQHTNLFVPKLPVNKLLAIEQLGIAAVQKIFLYYDRRWWNDSYTGNFFLWDPNDVKNGASWLTAVSVLVPVVHNPNVLQVWIIGDLVPEVEQCSDEVFINGIMYLLDYFGVVDSKIVTRPDAIARQVKNWYTNPYFRGAFSYQTPRTRVGQNSDEAILSEPLGNNPQKPNLLFAGEATSPDHYGTVHGAIDTGFREADRILKMYK
ncbi:hypothetical protein RN001_010337 [Aquatica leii]|uniref:Amine oxidase domain-containing protein n=1 Tax=Aquatica leii TaxID=1421715 RepID=A0AAN7S8J1_9COLE|nr:hypothetical protein RN001_010337 [Aquatica leii]